MSTFSSSSPSSDLMKRRKCEGRCDQWQNSFGLLGMIVYFRLVTMPSPMKLQFQITLSGTMKKPRNFSDSSSWHFSQQAGVKAAGLGLGLLLRNSQPLRVSLQAVRERLPGVKATLSTMVLSTAQLLFSLRNLVCMSASVTPSWFFSSGEVWIHPKSSQPLRNCDSGIWQGTVMPSLDPTCGTSTMALISLMEPSMVTPQRYPMIWIFRSEMHTNFLSRFLGMMQVKPDSLMSSELIHTLLVRISMLVADSARSRQSVWDLNCACSQLVVVVVVILWFWSLVVCTVTVAPSCAFASTFCRCSFCTLGGGSSMPRMMSLIYSWVRLATLTLFFLAQSLMTRFFISTSTLIHSSSVRVGQMWLGLVMMVLLGFMMPLVLSTFTCSERRMSISLEKAVKLDTDFSHSSQRLQSTICGSVAFRMSSANFSILSEDWKGSCRSLPFITMLGKSSRCTYSGSSIPLRVTITCRGLSSGGKALIKAATSSAVFHLAS